MTWQEYATRVKEVFQGLAISVMLLPAMVFGAIALVGAAIVVLFFALLAVGSCLWFC